MSSSATTVICRSSLFAGLAVLIVTLIFLRTDSRTPTGLESKGSWTMDGLSDKVPGHENPDKFFEYHVVIRRAEGGPGYRLIVMVHLYSIPNAFLVRAA